MTSDQEIAFHCLKKNIGCGNRFKSREFETEDFPEREWLRFQYFADCPACGQRSPQAGWQLAQWKTIHDHGSPGPASSKGRLAISKANQERDPESYALSRFSALTHGLSSTVAQFYPARPGKYAQCEGCEYLNDGCGTEMKHCAKRTELFVQFALAEETGDGRLLGKLMSNMQAGVAAITMDMVRDIAIRGVTLESPEFYIDKESGRAMAVEIPDESGIPRQLMKVEANPLLNTLIGFIQKNGTTLGDMGLTPAAREEQKRFDGFLTAAEESRESVVDARKEAMQGMQQLRDLLGGGRTMIEDGEVVEAEIIPNDE